MKISVLLFFIGMSTVFATPGFSQPEKVSLQMNDVTLRDVFHEIENQSDYSFFYNDQFADLNKIVAVNESERSIKDVLNGLLNSTDLSYKLLDDNLIVITPRQDKLLIKGKITDVNGLPLPGVTIVIKGTASGTSTDTAGSYIIEVTSPDDVLIFTFLGMKTQEMTVGNRVVINLAMEEDVTAIEAVVISTGYQQIKKEKMTGAVVAIGSDELDKRFFPSVVDNIEGRIPGLVNYRGTVSIRGVSTMRANTSALVVVDGLPIEGSIDGLNPYNIDNVTVLKDAAATAIYGVRASNGVIVVTTKSAAQNRTSVDFSSDVTIYNKPDYSYNHYMTASQLVDVSSNYYDYYFNGGVITDPVGQIESNIANNYNINPIQYAYYQLATGEIDQAQLDTKLNALRQYDFAEEYKDNALLNRMVQQYNLGIRTSGGNLKSNLVVNYKTDNSGIIKAYNKQLNLFYKGNYEVSKWLDIDFGVNTIIGKVRSHNSPVGTSPFNVPTYTRLLDDNGNRLYETYRSNIYNPILETTSKLYSLMYNHLDELECDFNDTRQLSSRYFVNLNFKILPGLTFNPQFQYEDIRNDVSAYSEAESLNARFLKDVYTTRSTAEPFTYTNLLPSGGGRLATSQTNGAYYTGRAQVNYEKEFGKNNFIIIAGTEFRETKTWGTKGLLLGYDDQLQSQATSSVDFGALSQLSSSFLWPVFDVKTYVFNPYLASAMGLNTETRHRYASAYANATYTYNRKYNVFGSYRKDYADLFGGDPKYRGRPLWSLGAAWNASNESFMESLGFVNNLKFRATYGITGNIDASATSSLTARSTYTNSYSRLPWAIVQTPPNPQLRWEKTATTNLGIDFALFDYRLTGSFDLYWRKGTDLLAQKRMDASKGFTSMLINNASMINNGIELSLDYEWIKPTTSDGFRWSSVLVISHNKNEITYVDEVTTNPQALAEGQGFKVGYPVHALYSYQYAGLSEEGNPQWIKADGTYTSGTIGSSDLAAMVFSGGTDPLWNISLTNEFSFKGLSLNVFAVYYGGHYLRARTNPMPYSSPSYGPLPDYIIDSWTPTNTDTDIPGFGQYYPTTTVSYPQMAYGDFLVRGGDFIKIRNIVLGYSLPESMSRAIKASNVRVRLQINNLKALWIKNDVDVDPETGGTPALQSYVFGINVNF